jgi:hypothetical protein
MKINLLWFYGYEYSLFYNIVTHNIIKKLTIKFE